jgi:hypothetical protein
MNRQAYGATFQAEWSQTMPHTPHAPQTAPHICRSCLRLIGYGWPRKWREAKQSLTKLAQPRHHSCVKGFKHAFRCKSRSFFRSANFFWSALTLSVDDSACQLTADLSPVDGPEPATPNGTASPTGAAELSVVHHTLAGTGYS